MRIERFEVVEQPKDGPVLHLFIEDGDPRDGQSPFVDEVKAFFTEHPDTQKGAVILHGIGLLGAEAIVTVFVRLGFEKVSVRTGRREASSTAIYTASPRAARATA